MLKLRETNDAPRNLHSNERFFMFRHKYTAIPKLCFEQLADPNAWKLGFVDWGVHGLSQPTDSFVMNQSNWHQAEVLYHIHNKLILFHREHQVARHLERYNDKMNCYGLE